MKKHIRQGLIIILMLAALMVSQPFTVRAMMSDAQIFDMEIMPITQEQAADLMMIGIVPMGAFPLPPPMKPIFVGPMRPPVSGPMMPASAAIDQLNKAKNLLMGAGGVNPTHPITFIPMNPMGELPADFCIDEADHIFGRIWGRIRDFLVADDDSFFTEAMHRAIDPATGQEVPVLAIPAGEVSTFFEAAGTDLAAFIGPINMTEAEQAWLVGNWFGVHVPEVRNINTSVVIGLYRSVPITSNWATVNMGNIANIFNVRNVMINNKIFMISQNATRNKPLQTYELLYRTYINGEWASNTAFNPDAILRVGTAGGTHNQCLFVNTRSTFVITTSNQVTGTLHQVTVGAWAATWNPNLNLTIAVGNPLTTIRFDEDITPVPPCRPQLDLNLQAQNIITSPATVTQTIRQISGAQADDDFIYFRWPDTIEEVRELTVTEIIIPQEWEVIAPGTQPQPSPGPQPSPSPAPQPPPWTVPEYWPEFFPWMNPENWPEMFPWINPEHWNDFFPWMNPEHWPAPPPWEWPDMPPLEIEITWPQNWPDNFPIPQPPPGPLTQQWLDTMQTNVNEINQWMQNANQADREVGEQIITELQRLPEAIRGPMDFDFLKGGAGGGGGRPMWATVFPFSIPFAFGSAITSLNVPPQAPRFTVDFGGTIFEGYVLDLNFDEFEQVATVIRWTVWLGFFIGLMFVTRKVIQW